VAGGHGHPRAIIRGHAHGSQANTVDGAGDALITLGLADAGALAGSGINRALAAAGDLRHAGGGRQCSNPDHADAAARNAGAPPGPRYALGPAQRQFKTCCAIGVFIRGLTLVGGLRHG